MNDMGKDTEIILKQLLRSVQMKHLLLVEPVGSHDRKVYQLVFTVPYVKDYTITVLVVLREEKFGQAAYMTQAHFQQGEVSYPMYDLEECDPDWIYIVPRLIADFAPVVATTDLARLVEQARFARYQMNQGYKL